MQGSISKKIITGGFWFALLIFISVSAIGYWNIPELIENSQRMKHAYQVQAKLELNSLYTQGCGDRATELHHNGSTFCGSLKQLGALRREKLRVASLNPE